MNKKIEYFSDVHRAQWKTRAGFVLAAIGSAVGLGNIWRFSYLCYENGGGAFLVPYFIALFTVGIPLMILEFGLGHREKGSAPKSFYKISPKWEWLGWWPVIFVMFGIVMYYAVVITWCFNYLFYSFKLSCPQPEFGTG
jgi:NSS family neurotransmitter:Na+ symporter